MYIGNTVVSKNETVMEYKTNEKTTWKDNKSCEVITKLLWFESVNYMYLINTVSVTLNSGDSLIQTSTCLYPLLIHRLTHTLPSCTCVLIDEWVVGDSWWQQWWPQTRWRCKLTLPDAMVAIGFCSCAGAEAWTASSNNLLGSHNIWRLMGRKDFTF